MIALDHMEKKIPFNLNDLIKGKQTAYKTLYFDTYDILFYLALSYVNKKEIAEDLVQDSFLTLWNNRENLNESTNILNFLYTLTKNNCLNHLKHLEVRNRYIHNRYLAELKFYQQSLIELPDSFSDLMAMKQDLEDAIETLPDDLKEIFRLNRFSELTYAKIAEKKKISVKTVEAKMSKAIRILRKALKEYYPLIMFFYYINNR